MTEMKLIIDNNALNGGNTNLKVSPQDVTWDMYEAAHKPYGLLSLLVPVFSCSNSYKSVTHYALTFCFYVADMGINTRDKDTHALLEHIKADKADELQHLINVPLKT